MFASKLLTGVVAGGLAASVIGLTAGTASAAYQADADDVLPAAAADLVGVGSDTSQVVIKDAAVAYNATNPTVKIATYAATGGGTITPPGGTEITRPNGSTAGKNTLYNPSNAGIDFARSSSGLSSTSSNNEVGASLQQIPFAVDTLVAVTAQSSNAPASLTRAQLLSIYKGDITNWSQLGGASGTIVPLLPQNGSGTRSFFLAQLAAENGGAAPTLGANVAEFQENDDASIRSNPNAVAPFSAGRAALLGTLRNEGGFTANRALYNVFRQGDVNATGVPAFFGPSGFLCSQNATRLIEDAGFRQLATAARGGECGLATQAATTNFTTNELQNTTSTLAGTSPSAGVARLVAGVTAQSSPQGTFSFFEGTRQLAANVPLVSGQATLSVTTTPGAHAYTARFMPAGGSVFRRSAANATVTVSSAATAPAAKSASRISESFPAKVKAKVKTKKGKTSVFVKPVKGSITIAGGTTRPTGTVLVKKGSKTVGSGSLVNGTAGLRINNLKVGTNKLTVTYGGDTATNSGVLSFTIKATKPGGKKKK